MPAKATVFHNCEVVRRMLIKHYTLGMPADAPPLKEEWVTRPCGTPLFDDEGRRTGVCRSCRSGWTDEQNYRVDNEAAPNV